MAQIRAHKLRSLLTALGVIIGIVAVTLMGTAIRGMDTSFENNLAMLGDDILYVQKWPWHNVDDWWNYANRPPVRPEDAASLNRVIAATPNSLLEIAVPVCARATSVRVGDNQVSGIYTFGTTGDYAADPRRRFQGGAALHRFRGGGGPAGVRPGLRRGRGALSGPLRPSTRPSSSRASHSASSASSCARARSSASSASTTSW